MGNASKKQKNTEITTPMPTPKEFDCQVMVLGDKDVGKSCLIDRLSGLECNFQDRFEGIQTQVTLKDKRHIANVKVTMHEPLNINKITRQAYEQTDCFIIVYDSQNPKSFENVQWYLKEIKQYTRGLDVTINLVGTHADKQNPKVSSLKASFYADNEDMSHYCINATKKAKDGNGPIILENLCKSFVEKKTGSDIQFDLEKPNPTRQEKFNFELTFKPTIHPVEIFFKNFSIFSMLKNNNILKNDNNQPVFPEEVQKHIGLMGFFSILQSQVINFIPKTLPKTTDEKQDTPEKILIKEWHEAPEKEENKLLEEESKLLEEKNNLFYNLLKEHKNATYTYPITKDDASNTLANIKWTLEDYPDMKPAVKTQFQFLQSICLLQLGETGAAIQCFDDMIKNADGPKEALLITEASKQQLTDMPNEVFAGYRFMRGLCHLRLGEINAAKSSLTNAVKNAGDNIALKEEAIGFIHDKERHGMLGCGDKKLAKSLSSKDKEQYIIR